MAPSLQSGNNFDTVSPPRTGKILPFYGAQSPAGTSTSMSTDVVIPSYSRKPTLSRILPSSPLSQYPCSDSIAKTIEISFAVNMEQSNRHILGKLSL
ncbi:hypothetical protein PMIN01_11870 [Paraphaeosphaeria minitans]|uniref:Uncharacterized protein n=1 Tax=Paraphaeosphaeria minitans TaxID=565426 RepID=A0A9P6KKL6_9PLEO|nr:hypothetical protein PMIN01_11870 [Paraphaeosphaeria minitans]